MKGASLFFLTFLGVSILSTGLVYGWPWNRDMYDQPSLKTQERPQDSPPQSIPKKGKERPLDRLKDSARLINPVAATEQSLQSGKQLFGIYCTPCHGLTGQGDGTVSRKFIPAAPLPQLTSTQPDGYLYLTVRHGGAIMPAYGSSLSQQERWDIVNYLRALEKMK